MTLTREQVIAAPIESYSAEDRAFYAFWYAHMKDDMMQPPLNTVHHAVARLIYTAGRDQGLREAKEADAERWQNAMFTVQGHAEFLRMQGQQDMPLFFMELAELIAKTHVDDAHAERMAQLRAAAIEQLRGK